jgi:DNA-directed RNA polymerase specialized sigma24 family protein
MQTVFRKERLEAIDKLPFDERKVVILCGVLGVKEESDDPTVVTAATLCGVTGRTVRNRLKRAAAKLSNFKGDV